MKIVRDYECRKDAINLAAKLEENGIVPHVGIYKGNNTAIYSSGPKTYGVWVLLDRQHEDATRLVRGNRHIVADPLSQEEIEMIKADFFEENRKAFVYFAISVFLAVGLFTAAAIILRANSA